MFLLVSHLIDEKVFHNGEYSLHADADADARDLGVSELPNQGVVATPSGDRSHLEERIEATNNIE